MSAVGPIAVAILCLPCAFAPGASAGETVWLCKPGIAANPCRTNLKTTIVSPAGRKLGVRNARPARRPPIDCFYVYPTVSDQPTPNATLEIDPEQRSSALYQAARFSQVCRVFAPVYRQVTWAGVLGAPGNFDLAYTDVLAAWRTYLRRYSHGRGVVLIGHSQGTVHLRRLLSEEIDPRRSLRRRLVSALLLGWPLLATQGEGVGGDFQHVGACRQPRQVGCLIAFSTFNEPAPPDALFGRTRVPGMEVLCTTPGFPRGGGTALRSQFPTAPFLPGSYFGATAARVGFKVPAVSTPWVETVAYRGRCESAGGANVLQVSGLSGAAQLLPSPDPTWGLHFVDAGIALGNLVSAVRIQATVYSRRH